MPQYTSVCLNKEASDYALGPICQKSEYGRVLIVLALHSVLNLPEYVLTEFWIYQNMCWQSSGYILCSKCARISNMAGLWTCKSYAWF